jgi:hypothetical protein
VASSNESDRQLLVRCEVTNREGDPSVRFVEYGVFRLWQYMMASKHGLVVHNLGIAIWMPEQDWQAQRQLTAASVEEVQRLSFAIYDRGTGLCNTMQRYVLSTDADQVRDLLLQRVSAEVRQAGDFAIDVEAGRAVARDGTADPVSLGHGLSEFRRD